MHAVNWLCVGGVSFATTFDLWKSHKEFNFDPPKVLCVRARDSDYPNLHYTRSYLVISNHFDWQQIKSIRDLSICSFHFATNIYLCRNTHRLFLKSSFNFGEYESNLLCWNFKLIFLQFQSHQFSLTTPSRRFLSCFFVFYFCKAAQASTFRRKSFEIVRRRRIFATRAFAWFLLLPAAKLIRNRWIVVLSNASLSHSSAGVTCLRTFICPLFSLFNTWNLRYAHFSHHSMHEGFFRAISGDMVGGQQRFNANASFQTCSLKWFVFNGIGIFHA